jgi:hypothetical protein
MPQLELEADEQLEILWALLHWRASAAESKRMSDERLGWLIERVRADIHGRQPVRGDS